MIIKKYLNNIIVSLLFVLITLALFSVYYSNTLKGNINNHILSSEMFGVPKHLEDKEIIPLYTGKNETGWDGQFYYYISNDIFNQYETSQNIDSPPYRYQRVGLSLFTNLLSKATFQTWVSPLFFFTTYFALIFCATFVGSLIFQDLYGKKNNLIPFLILFWSGSIGVQLTLFNALPDAAADAFFIFAVFCLMKRKNIFASFFLTFAALSREVYVLLPIILFSVYAYQQFYFDNKSLNFKNIKKLFHKDYIFFLFPVLIFVTWQLWINHKFGSFASSHATGILNIPLSSWFDYFISGIQKNHIFVGKGNSAYFEAFGLIFFLVTLILNLFFAFHVALKKNELWLKSIAIFSIFLSFLYISFGPTVMMHYTGYLKALSIFLFLIFLFISNTNVTSKFISKLIYLFFLISTIICLTINYKIRISVSPSFNEYTKLDRIQNLSDIECVTDMRYRSSIKDFKILKYGFNSFVNFNVDLTNLSDTPLQSTKGNGSIHLSYQWIKDNVVVQDGIRTAIIEPLLPGDTRSFNLISSFDISLNDIQFKISPVQEGCSWYYLKN